MFLLYPENLCRRLNVISHLNNSQMQHRQVASVTGTEKSDFMGRGFIRLERREVDCRALAELGSVEQLNESS